MALRLRWPWTMLLCLLCFLFVLIVEITTRWLKDPIIVYSPTKNNYIANVALHEAILQPEKGDPPSCFEDIMKDGESSRIKQENMNTFFDFKKSIKEKYKLCLEKLKPGHLIVKTGVMWRKHWDTNSTVTACKVNKTELQKNINVSFSDEPLSYEELIKMHSEIYPGGFYPGPKDCDPTHSTVIIIPIRDQDVHLRYWLQYVIRILVQQKIRFMTVVVEQEGGGLFNKGQLMNAGFLWAKNKFSVKWDCYVLHDVDMISEIPSNMYMCNKNAIKYLSPFTDKFHYSMWLSGVTLGGVMGVTGEQYEEINGHSNLFYGWGGEDDDFNNRVLAKKYKIIRTNNLEYGRYMMVPHKRDLENPVNPRRYGLIKTSKKRMSVDGLNNLPANISVVLSYPLFTKLKVKVMPKSKMDFGDE